MRLAKGWHTSSSFLCNLFPNCLHHSLSQINTMWLYSVLKITRLSAYVLRIRTKLRVRVQDDAGHPRYAHAFFVVEHVFLLRFCGQEKCRWWSLRLECQHSPTVTSAECRHTGCLPKCARDSRPGLQMLCVCYNLCPRARVNTASTMSKLWGHAGSIESEQCPICWMWYMSQTILSTNLHRQPFVKIGIEMKWTYSMCDRYTY